MKMKKLKVPPRRVKDERLLIPWESHKILPALPYAKSELVLGQDWVSQFLSSFRLYCRIAQVLVDVWESTLSIADLVYDQI